MNIKHLAILPAFIGSLSFLGEDITPVDSRWQIQASETRVERYLDRESLYLRDGIALLEGVEFQNGVIEYDVAFPKTRGFIGCLWRAQDMLNYEHFYIRPHQSGNPDANQYTPVFGGVSAWQLYHGEGYAAPVEYRYDEWVHVKIDVSGDQALVSIDAQESVLKIADLKRSGDSGMVGFNAFTCPAYFSNIQITPRKESGPQPERTKSAEQPPEVIDTWSVSNSFDEKQIEDALVFPAQLGNTLEWAALDADASGVANLAEVAEFASSTNTAVARIVVQEREQTTRRIRFGYSDRVRVYVNAKLIYSGDNTYRSRDYRYLGTIGLFDEIIVPMDAGRNEIWLAVTESFGGWGVMGEIIDPDGIVIH